MENELDGTPLAKRPDYKGTYGKMVLVAESFYRMAIDGVKQVLPTLQQNKISQNVMLARKNSNNPNAYKYYMTQAHKYRCATVENASIDARINKELNSPQLQKISNDIKNFPKKLLHTEEGMKKYNSLQV